MKAAEAFAAPRKSDLSSITVSLRVSFDCVARVCVCFAILVFFVVVASVFCEVTKLVVENKITKPLVKIVHKNLRGQKKKPTNTQNSKIHKSQAHTHKHNCFFSFLFFAKNSNKSKKRSKKQKQN